MPVRDALDALRRGGFVLLHDSKGRENEFDMVAAAQFVTPGSVATMRRSAGGLLCVAIGRPLADRLGLSYMHEMLAASGLPRDSTGRSPWASSPRSSAAPGRRSPAPPVR